MLCRFFCSLGCRFRLHFLRLLLCIRAGGYFFGVGRFSRCLFALGFRKSDLLAALKACEVIIHSDTDLFHRLRPDALNGFELFRRHVGKSFNGGNTGALKLLDNAFAQAFDALQRSRSRAGESGHLLLNFLPLLFLALDIDLPAKQLCGQTNVLPLLADRKRQLAVVDHDFEVLLHRIDHSHAADLRGLQRLFGKRHRIFVILDDVDLLAAKFADDGLHTHALHADARAHRVHFFVFRHDCDLGAFAGFTGNSADHNCTVINFRDFRLEKVLHQFRRGARDNDTRSLRSFFNASDHHADTLANGKRFKPRLFFTRSFRFRFADIEDHVRAFDPLYSRVDDLAHAADVLVVHSVALGFAHLLENDLLRKLRGDAAENSFGLFRNVQFPADLDIGINLARIIDRHLQSRIFDLLGRLYNAFHCEGADLSRVFIEMGAQVFLGLVVLAGGDNNRIFHRAHHNLRINALLSTESVNCVVELACHKKPSY